MKKQEFWAKHGKKISQESELLFFEEFLLPILEERGLEYLEPQKIFIDSTGKSRKIDFFLQKDKFHLALEVNGESYHSEGIIPNEVFDDNLFRQNEIIRQGWTLLRFSYTQLQDKRYRQTVSRSIIDTINQYKPEILSQQTLQKKVKPLQQDILNELELCRRVRHWKKGILVLPMAFGKTFISALDAKRVGGKILYLAHRIDILTQAKAEYDKVFHELKLNILTSDSKEDFISSDILFASKDSLRKPEILSKLPKDHYDYIIIDEVHHGAAPTYKQIIDYFNPKFLLGLTATPERMDRKDIFELFDYNNIFEISKDKAIEEGYLVPYDYYGLIDNIDYSKIKWNGKSYNLRDLEKNLIIKERNEKIFEEYVTKGGCNKAIGFCVSIKHAEVMAKLFNEKGIPSIAITSKTDDREVKIDNYRKNKYFVVFTVDLFNEGIDIPNVRTLMFLRPTESKTIFSQQLGRGLRTHYGKDRVVILDFIGNYKRANNIRKFLAKEIIQLKKGNKTEKPIYEYTPECKIIFDPQVEEILDNQDTNQYGPDEQDLREAYYELAEKLKRKPSLEEVNKEGKFKIFHYTRMFGSWSQFLKIIGEYTEASYHYPQGIHLGHVLYITKIVNSGMRKLTLIDDKYIRIYGNLSTQEREGKIQRQTKYKLQGMMEMGLLIDGRKIASTGEKTGKRDASEDVEDKNQIYYPLLTSKGEKFFILLQDLINNIDLKFNNANSWRMRIDSNEFNKQIWNFIRKNLHVKNAIRNILLDMPAAIQMLNFLYQFGRKKEYEKQDIYSNFFKWKKVKEFCNRNGIEESTEEGAKHRCPFLLNILESLGIISQSSTKIMINFFLISKKTIEIEDISLKNISLHYNNLVNKIDSTHLSILKEKFGKDFGTPNYVFEKFEVMDVA